MQGLSHQTETKQNRFIIIYSVIDPWSIRYSIRTFSLDHKQCYDREFRNGFLGSDKTLLYFGVRCFVWIAGNGCFLKCQVAGTMIFT